MSEPNEFEESEQIRDLEFLKKLRPEWENDRLEPLTPPPEDSVVPPTWQKAQIDIPQVAQSSNASEVQPGTTKVICAVQEGSTYVPKLMTPVEGTLFEDP